MLEASGASINWRCNAAKVCSSSQTNNASARFKMCCCCGLDRARFKRSKKVHNFSELCKIRVSMG